MFHCSKREAITTAFEFAQIAHDAGLTAGVLNVIAGFGRTSGQAVEGAILGAFMNQGEVCIAGTRALIQDEIMAGERS